MRPLTVETDHTTGARLSSILLEAEGRDSVSLDSASINSHALEAIQRINADLQEQVRAQSDCLLTAYQRLGAEIAAREIAEQALYHLSAVVESADVAIISKSLDGIVRSWNPGAERLFGYQAAEMIAEPVTRIFPRESVQEEADILARLKCGERIEHYETIRRRKDSTLVPVLLTISPVRDGAGNIIGASKIARDLTDQKQYEAHATLVAQLRKALAEIKMLRGLITICAWCKKIQDDKAIWHKLENYIADRTEATFTHGICPDCYQKNSRTGLPFQTDHRAENDKGK